MLKKILIGVGALVLALIVLGIYLPKDFVVEREIIINKPKEMVFNNLKFLKNHDSWSPWSAKDPKMIKNYNGEDGKVGFISSWAGNSEVGVGEQEIKNIVDGERIDFELRFKEPMEDTSAAYLIIESIGENQTRVKWGMKGNSPIPRNIVFFLMSMKKMIGNDFQSGLETLKKQLDSEGQR